MSDLISRQAAIDCLNNVSFDCSMDQEVVEEELLKLPSVQPEQRWIPVTETLPENDDKVLITHSRGVSMAWWNGRYWTGSMIRKYKTVTAWLPLPEPWKGEEDETDRCRCTD